MYVYMSIYMYILFNC